MSSQFIIQVETKETSLRLRNPNFRTFLFDNGIVFLHDVSGREPSIYYDVHNDNIVRRASIKFGDRTKQLVVLVQNRFLVAIAAASLVCYNMTTSQYIALPPQRRAPGLHNGTSNTHKDGIATLVTNLGLYVFRTTGSGSAMKGVAGFLLWTRDSPSLAWTTLSPFPGLKHATAIEIDSKIYLIGSDEESRTWIYTPSRDSWQEGPSLKVPRRSALVLLMDESTIVVLGGNTGSEPAHQVEVCNPRNSEEFIVVGHVSRTFNEGNNNAVAIGKDIFLFARGESYDSAAILTTIHIPSQFLSGDALVPVPPPVDSLEEIQIRSSMMRVGVQTLLEPPPEPGYPTMSASVPVRIMELTDYASRLTTMKQEFNRTTLPETTTRITEWYNRARDEAIVDTEREAESWNASVDKRLEEVNDTLSQLECLKQHDAPFFKAVLEPPEEDDFEDGIPSQLRCPITLSLMKDPVVACDGNVYERAALEKWFRNHEQKNVDTKKPLLSPLTGAVLSSNAIFPVHTLKGLCQDYALQHKCAD